jgi:magnesium-transporting ATPase (P-type)
MKKYEFSFLAGVMCGIDLKFCLFWFFFVRFVLWYFVYRLVWCFFILFYCENEHRLGECKQEVQWLDELASSKGVHSSVFSALLCWTNKCMLVQQLVQCSYWCVCLAMPV